MIDTWLITLLHATAQEPCYDEMHVFSPWLPHSSLAFGTVYRICGICGHPESMIWIDDA